MHFLVLGGTVFLGRHVVEAATAAGHAVTMFTRGLTQPGLPKGIEQLSRLAPPFLRLRWSHRLYRRWS